MTQVKSSIMQKNDNFYKIANQNKPHIYNEKIPLQRLIQLKPDDTKFGGVKVSESDVDKQFLSKKDLNKGDKIILDFGQHCVGKLNLHIESHGEPMDSPLYLHLKLAELPAELVIDSASYHGWISSSWIQEEYIHIDELPCDLKLPRRYAFRYVEIEVKDTSSKWSARISNPFVISESAVTMDAVAPLKIADKTLEKIDAVSIKTLHDCMQDVFEDGPKRDRRLWLGDLRLQALANYQTFKDYGLVKRCLYLFGGSITTDNRIPADVFIQPKITPDSVFLLDYSLLFVAVLKDYFWETKDHDTLNDLYPIAKRTVNEALNYVDDSGILEACDSWKLFVDWSKEIDKKVSGQAILIYALKQLVQLADIQSDPDLNFYQQKISTLSANSVNKLFDQQKGLFVSNGQLNIASQVWMVLAHVLPDEENKKLMDKSITTFFPIKGIATPYMYHHIAQALLESDHRTEAVQLIKDYWGKMIELGADTFWEAFEPDNLNFSPYGSLIINSYCHAWSCTPTYLIRKYL